MLYKVENCHAASREQYFLAHLFKIFITESLSQLNYKIIKTNIKLTLLETCTFKMYPAYYVWEWVLLFIS